MLKHMHARMTTSQKDASLLSRIIPSLRHQNCQKSKLFAMLHFVLYLLSTSVISAEVDVSIGLVFVTVLCFSCFTS